MTLRLATRGSALARWQAEAARAALGADAALVVVESSGDRDRATDLARFGSIGIFTAEVDRTLLAGDADVGVHSLKDLTTTLEEGVVLAGVLPRGPVEDVVVSRDGVSLADLPAGAKVGSGSARRAAMVRAERGDLELVPIRGNVETRLEKVARGEVDATLLARAGLERLGLADRATEVLDAGRFVPAVGQGIVGLTCRDDDGETRERLASARDELAWAEALAERAMLRILQGGCHAPVGGHATTDGGRLVLRARVVAVDGSRAIEDSIDGAFDDAEALGAALGRQLLGAGAGELLEEARG